MSQPRPCGCVSVNPHDCLEERHRRWPRESADYFDGDACRCRCHGEDEQRAERADDKCVIAGMTA